MRLLRAPRKAAGEAASTTSELGSLARGADTRDALLDEAVIAELDALDGILLSDLLNLFFDEVASHVLELSRTIPAGEEERVAQIAHKIKGNSSSIGATHVARIASELETTAKAGDLRPAEDLLDTLRYGLDSTSKAFSRDRKRAPA